MNDGPRKTRTLHSNRISFVGKLALTLVSTVSLLCYGGCGELQTDSANRIVRNKSLLDDSKTEFHNLGWLGARTYPLSSALSFADPGDSENLVSPGGLVVAKVLQGLPAEESGLVKDDIIVGVEDQWIPIKDDPTLDVMQLLENRITSRQKQTLLKVYRDGEVLSLTVANIASSLDDGMPENVTRFVESASKGVQYLVSLQNEDGSFGMKELSNDAKLQVSALSGLALLSVADEKLQNNIEQCKKFIATELDRMVVQPSDGNEPGSEAQAEDAKSALPSGALRMQIPELDIQPLTAAYVGQFLAEAKVSMLDQRWMSRLIGIVGALNRTQHASGAWSVTKVIEEDAPDTAATFVTNEILLSIGMLERIGVAGNTEMIKKACGYLASQLELRAGSNIDRRLKSVLTAGTGAALVAINCQPSDPLLERAIDDGLELIGEIHGSPTLNLPGMLTAAVLAKQTGSENWLRFHEHTKWFLAAIASPDGHFVSPPLAGSKPLDLETNRLDPAWSVAHYCLLLSMQSGHLETLTAQTSSPMGIARNGAGEESSGSSVKPGMPPGLPGNGQTMTFTIDDLSGEGSLEDQLKEKLKEMGIETDNLKIGTQLGGASEDSKTEKGSGKN